MSAGVCARVCAGGRVCKRVGVFVGERGCVNVCVRARVCACV